MNACIVGFGCIGPVHAEALKSIEGVSLYAVCDVVKDRAESGATKFNSKAYYNYEDCLLDANIDVVHICTPHYLHFDMIKKALDAGKYVVIEKPVTINKAELDYLIEKYETDRVFPIVQNRTNACIVRMKELISSNDYGNLKGVKGLVTWHRDAHYYNSESWRGKKEFEGGGVLINQAFHTLDIMVYLGGKVKSVQATMKNYSLVDVIDVEDTLDAYINFENGAKGIFYATNAYIENDSVQLELVFDKAKFLYRDNKLFLNEELICSDDSEFTGKKYWGNGHVKTLNEYYSNKSALSLSSVKNTMETIFAIYESAEKGNETII